MAAAEQVTQLLVQWKNGDSRDAWRGAITAINTLVKEGAGY